jgi:cytosine/adenosine deaminase-related metal-dependent hydrolase
LNQLPVAAPLWIHLAEGVDAIAATEVEQLDRMGLLSPNLVAIHVVGPDAAGIERLCASAPGIVWCPTSNLFLFGVTAPRELLERCSEVMLGSDSLLTADGTLLDELRVARQLGVLSDHALVDAVNEVPARRLGLPAPALDVGAPADIIALRKPLLDAATDDVALVLVAGVPRSADEHCADIFAQCGLSADDVEWRGVRRKVSVELAQAQRSVDKSRASRTSSTRISSA